MTAPSAPGRDGADRDWQRLLDGLRTYPATYTYVTHQLARWLGVHPADANAFAEVLYAEDRGDPLSPARLAARISLSSGATTSLLNRLEKAGLVVRSRENTDRRIVTLRSVEAVTTRAWTFFEPLARRVEDVRRQFSDDELHTVARFVALLNEATTGAVADNEARADEWPAPGPRA